MKTVLEYILKFFVFGLHKRVLRIKFMLKKEEKMLLKTIFLKENDGV